MLNYQRAHTFANKSSLHSQKMNSESVLVLPQRTPSTPAQTFCLLLVETHHMSICRPPIRLTISLCQDGGIYSICILYIYIYTQICACRYMRAHTHTRIHLYIQYIYIYIYVCVCACVRMRYLAACMMHACIYVHM